MSEAKELVIRNLHVTVGTPDGPKQILKGVDLTIKPGEIHAVMGPNGSGKSTLAYALAGHPNYEVTEGEVLLDGEDVLAMSVDQRAQAGLFLAMQYPVEVAGVSVSNLLRTAKTAIDGKAPAIRHWVKRSRQQWNVCVCPPTLLNVTSMLDSPVVRRSAWRSCRWNCWSPLTRSLTKRTRALTLMRYALSPRA